MELVTEEQDWQFSLREVARRAGVSHNAPYNHFPDKNDLLSELAAVGFDNLRDGMRSAMDSVDSPEEALAVAGRVYVRYGTKNPALYRLMFGPVLSDSAVARTAGARARAVLEEIILRGARAGIFRVSVDDKRDLASTTLSVWSAVHGLTMLMIDNLVGPNLAKQEMVERMIEMQQDALRA
jgi:AcrR family transcriptional regulator